MGRAEEVLKGLAALRDGETLCDVRLEAQGKQIAAHKCVLAVSSEYFKAFFSGNFTESGSPVVHIKEVSFAGKCHMYMLIAICKLKKDGPLMRRNVESPIRLIQTMFFLDVHYLCVSYLGGSLGFLTGRFWLYYV